MFAPVTIVVVSTEIIEELGTEEGEMAKSFFDLRLALAALHREESGQDLVEYTMVAAIIALGAIAVMGYIARQINEIFLALTNKFRNAL